MIELSDLMNRIFALILVSILSLRAEGSAPRMKAPGVFSGTNFKTDVSAEWRGTMASSEFPSSTREFYEDFLSKTFEILSLSPLAQDNPFLGKAARGDLV